MLPSGKPPSEVFSAACHATVNQTISHSAALCWRPVLYVFWNVRFAYKISFLIKTVWINNSVICVLKLKMRRALCDDLRRFFVIVSKATTRVKTLTTHTLVTETRCRRTRGPAADSHVSSFPLTFPTKKYRYCNWYWNILFATRVRRTNTRVDRYFATTALWNWKLCANKTSKYCVYKTSNNNYIHLCHCCEC